MIEGMSGGLVVSPDAIRGELCGDAADQSRNAEVFKIAHELLVGGINDPTISVVVFDATSVQKRSRVELLKICAEHKAETALLVFDADFGVCMERNENRERTVPLHAMVRMQTSFEESLDEVASEGWDSVLDGMNIDAPYSPSVNDDFGVSI
jgi:predicted kinase